MCGNDDEDDHDHLLDDYGNDEDEDGDEDVTIWGDVTNLVEVRFFDIDGVRNAVWGQVKFVR